MKNILILALLLLLAPAVFAASPTFNSFDTNQFNVNAGANTIAGNTNAANPKSLVSQGQLAPSVGSQVGPSGSNYLSAFGVTNASNAASGIIGEFTNRIVPFSSATNIISDVPTNIITLTLSPGDWDVEGAVNVTLTSASVTRLRCGITTTSATIPVDGTAIFSGVQTTLLSISDSASIPRMRINTSISTNVFLVLQETFTAGSVVGYGTMSARRVR